jgi:predicted nucleic acid-binding protein
VKYLLDTCVVSELTRPKPMPSVVNWVRSQREEHLFLSVLTLGELRKGIPRLPDSRKKVRLENWLDSDLKLRFAGRWLPVDEEVAERWGLLSSDAASRGFVLPVLDGLIAATALVHGMTVVTRNTDDVRGTAVLLFNPWDATTA